MNREYFDKVETEARAAARANRHYAIWCGNPDCASRSTGKRFWVANAALVDGETWLCPSCAGEETKPNLGNWLCDQCQQPLEGPPGAACWPEIASRV